MTGTGQRVSNIGDISEVNYTLAGMMNVLRVKGGGALFLFRTVAFVSILFALAGCGTAHDNFKNSMQLQVGRDLFDRDLIRNRYPQDRGGTRTLPNGNLEEEFLWNRSTGCRVFFEIDKTSQRITRWRYEGNRDTCY